jgi:hypothetical protein
VRCADFPAAIEAGRLLSLLGATVERSEPGAVALSAGDITVEAPAWTPEQDWIGSGLHELTGRPDGPPLIGVGRPATVARAALTAFELLTALRGVRVPAGERAVLTERAALYGYSRQGDVSAGGSARLLPCRSGWFVLNLARDADFELVPALVASDCGARSVNRGARSVSRGARSVSRGARSVSRRARTVGGEAQTTDGAWAAVRDWARDADGTQLVARATLLGLAAGLVPGAGAAGGAGAAAVAPTSPWTVTSTPAEPARRDGSPPLVVNLGSLWAAPLCANLLRQAGARVVDVESTTRPDGARMGQPEFFRILHEGNELHTIDFNSTAGRAQLRNLLRSAQVVIEASRPRALQALGAAPEDLLYDGVARTWIQITGHGAAEPLRIGYGDDAAVVGGLVGWDENGPVFVGDAVADPLTGTLAALVALGFLEDRSTTLAELSLSGVAHYCADDTRGRWR